MAIQKNTGPETIHVTALRHEEVTLRLIGETPLYMNSMNAKAMRTLLVGGGKKTTAEKKTQIKHDVLAEFRASVYREPTYDGPGGPLLAMPAPAIKNAIATAALEVPGAKKTQINRLVFLPQLRIPIWGVPKLKMDVVRSADMNKTPDVRTRAYLPEWCAEVTIKYVVPVLASEAIVTLLSAAGIIMGIGDFRQEKGRGCYGSFRVTGTDMDDRDAEAWERITKCAADVQQAALDNPETADDETADLFEFYQDWLRREGKMSLVA